MPVHASVDHNLVLLLSQLKKACSQSVQNRLTSTSEPHYAPMPLCPTTAHLGQDVKDGWQPASQAHSAAADTTTATGRLGAGYQSSMQLPRKHSHHHDSLNQVICCSLLYVFCAAASTLADPHHWCVAPSDFMVPAVQMSCAVNSSLGAAGCPLHDLHGAAVAAAADCPDLSV